METVRVIKPQRLFSFVGYYKGCRVCLIAGYLKGFLAGSSVEEGVEGVEEYRGWMEEEAALRPNPSNLCCCCCCCHGGVAAVSRGSAAFDLIGEGGTAPGTARIDIRIAVGN